ncbi:MAG: FmdE family protein [Thermoleophilia bacterium]
MDGEIKVPNEVQALVDFHGHLCPGLLIGYRAALLAAESLGAGASEDEELVLIAENDSCSVDAFQALLSTTFGKGNLIFRDYGKQVFTLGDRRTGRAVRVALRFDAFDSQGGGREERIERLLKAPAQELFNVTAVILELPEAAQVHETLRCERCREGVMATRAVESGGKRYCLPCAGDMGLGGDR